MNLLAESVALEWWHVPLIIAAVVIGSGLMAMSRRGPW